MVDFVYGVGCPSHTTIPMLRLGWRSLLSRTGRAGEQPHRIPTQIRGPAIIVTLSASSRENFLSGHLDRPLEIEIPLKFTCQLILWGPHQHDLQPGYGYDRQSIRIDSDQGDLLHRACGGKGGGVETEPNFDISKRGLKSSSDGASVRIRFRSNP